MDKGRSCGHSNKHARGMCKSCYNKWWYRNNKERYKNRDETAYYMRRWLSRGVRKGHCSRCGFVPESPSQMDLHHVLGEKKINISRATKSRGMDKLIKEINKCVLLCANCHRLVEHGGVAQG